MQEDNVNNESCTCNCNKKDEFLEHKESGVLELVSLKNCL